MTIRMPGRLIFFWDYDTQWGADASRSVGGPKNWGHLEFENTERLLDLHATYRIPACFAVVGAAALAGERPYHDPYQIRRIYEAGHEIASHSMQHEWLPGLGYLKLQQILRESKDALEQCIGSQVTSFVPPYNQPFDCSSRWSISFSERMQAGADRIDLHHLCKALSEAGYRFSRVSYHPLYERIFEKVLGKQKTGLSHIEKIGNITCLRLRIRAGFREQTRSVLEQCVRAGSLAVVYGHPHSLHSANSQDEQYLIPFMEQVRSKVMSRQIEVILPRQLDSAEA